MHLPRFEQISALKHHCGICKTPFSNPSSLSTCIGKHEVICSQYHFMFHFVGKAHTCKACTNTKAQQQKRHRAILLLVQEYHRANGDEDESVFPAAKKGLWLDEMKKEEPKTQKNTSKTTLRLEIVKQSDLARLQKLIYDNDDNLEDADQALADALAVKYLPHVFSEKRMLDILMAPPKEKPNLELEAERVVCAFELKAPQSKAMRLILKKIKDTIKEDMDVQWKTEFAMKKRRIIYAQWVTQGAVDHMALHYEDWDIHTGARTNRRYKGETRSSKDRSGSGVFDDDLRGPDDLDSKDDFEGTQLKQTAKIKIKDERHGGIVPGHEPPDGKAQAWDDENYAAAPKATTPTLRIVMEPKNDGTSRRKAGNLKPFDLSVEALTPRSFQYPQWTSAYRPGMSSPLAPKSSSMDVWAQSSNLHSIKSPPANSLVHDMVEPSPAPRMAASLRIVTSPTFVDVSLDDEWISVGKKGKTKVKKGIDE